MMSGQNEQDYEERERKSLYIAGWILLGLGVVFLVLQKTLGFIPGRLPCLFHTITGAYCPGCGGSRAVEQLLQGHLLQSFCYHPVVLYGGALYLWFMVSNTIEYLLRGRIRIGLRWHKAFAIGGIIVLVLNFIFKNAVLLFWNIPMIK